MNMNHEIIDIGINLAHRRFDSDRAEVLARAHAAGVAKLVITGTSVLPTANLLVMRQRVRDFVEAHLQDADLNCEKIAAAHRISVRYLHKLFAGAEHPISEWIWLRRLERARQAIETSSVTGQSITQIAYTWGFGDPAHFSRAFKARFGVSPSALRGNVPR